MFMSLARGVRLFTLDHIGDTTKMVVMQMKYKISALDAIRRVANHSLGVSLRIYG
jgi:hypothetical protein